MKRYLLVIFMLGILYLNGTVVDQFIEDIEKGNFAKAEESYNKTLVEVLKPGRLEIVWNSLAESAGKYDKVVSTTADVREEFTSYTVVLKFEYIFIDMLITVDKEELLSGLFFKPSTYSEGEEKLPPYVDKKSYFEEEVEFMCGDYLMKGSLVVPKGRRGFPILVMATGSGPNDRDETVGSNKPFRDLAYGLGSMGVATLRYDKRTLTFPKLLNDKPDFDIDDEYTVEVKAAVDFVTEKYKGRNIYYLGHSMGAFMAPRILNNDSRIKAAVMMAANARPLEDLVYEQVEYIMNMNDSFNQKDLDEIAVRRDNIKKIKDISVKVEGTPLLGLSKEYWLSLNRYNLIEEAAVSKNPILVLQGERDYQVTMTDFNIWKSNFDLDGNWNFLSYEKLNHLFMSGEGPSKPKEYMVPNFVDRTVIKDISNWILNLESGRRK